MVVFNCYKNNVFNYKKVFTKLHSKSFYSFITIINNQPQPPLDINRILIQSAQKKPNLIVGAQVTSKIQQPYCIIPFWTCHIPNRYLGVHTYTKVDKDDEILFKFFLGDMYTKIKKNFLNYNTALVRWLHVEISLECATNMYSGNVRLCYMLRSVVAAEAEHELRTVKNTGRFGSLKEWPMFTFDLSPDQGGLSNLPGRAIMFGRKKVGIININ